MGQHLGTWALIFVLMMSTTGCGISGRQASQRVSNATPDVELLSETYVVSYLTTQGLDVQVKAQEKAAITPMGTADSSLLVAELKEVSVAVFASPSEAATGLKIGMDTARWPRPTTLILWRNVVVVVTKSDDSSGIKIVKALEPVAELVKTTP